MNQLLSIHEDLFAARKFSTVENRQEVTNTLPGSPLLSSLYNPSLHSKSIGHADIKELAAEIPSSTVEDRLQDVFRTPLTNVDRLSSNLVDKCFSPFVQQVTTFINFLNNFGINDPLLDKLQTLVSRFLNGFTKGAKIDNNTFKIILSSLTSLLQHSTGSSEELVHIEQLESNDWNFLFHLLRGVVNILGDTIPNRTEDGSFKNILNAIAKWFSAPLDSEGNIEFINNTLNFVLGQIDSPIFKWSKEFKHALKNFAKSVLPALFKSLHDEEPSKEDKMNFLKSLVKFLIAGFNIKAINTDSLLDQLFLNDQTNGEMNNEQQRFLGIVFQNVAKILSELMSEGIEINQQGCEDIVQEMFQIIFNFYLPNQLNSKGDSKGVVMNVGSWRVAQERK